MNALNTNDTNCTPNAIQSQHNDSNNFSFITEILKQKSIKEENLCQNSGSLAQNQPTDNQNSNQSKSFSKNLGDLPVLPANWEFSTFQPLNQQNNNSKGTPNSMMFDFRQQYVADDSNNLYLKWPGKWFTS